MVALDFLCQRKTTAHFAVPSVRQQTYSEPYCLIAPAAGSVLSRLIVLHCGLPTDSIPGRSVVPPIARRHVYDPLEPTKELRRYVVRNMRRTVIEARVLPAGADLNRALVAAMLEHIDAGWRLGEFSSRTGFFFCDKACERLMVEITPSDPGPWRHV